jgi:hypothetical protein
MVNQTSNFKQSPNRPVDYPYLLIGPAIKEPISKPRRHGERRLIFSTAPSGKRQHDGNRATLTPSKSEGVSFNIQERKMPKIITYVIALMMASFALWGFAPAARANQTPLCTVLRVEFHTTTGASADPRLVLRCNNDSNVYSAFYAATAGTGTCPIITPAQVQAWASLGLAAYLSGTLLTIDWSNTCGQITIDDLIL